MKSVWLSVATGAMLTWWVPGSLAYPPNSTPFGGKPPAQMPMAPCIRVQPSATESGPNSRLMYSTSATNAHMILIESRTDPDRLLLSLQSPAGRVILAPALIAQHSAMIYVGRPYFGDLNADGLTDYFIPVSMGGCGSAAGYDDAVVVLSRNDGYNVSIVPTYCAGPEDFVDTNGDGIAEILQTTGTYIDEPGHERFELEFTIKSLAEVELESGESSAIEPPLLAVDHAQGRKPSPEWFIAVDSILGISDPQGHGPDLDSDEWRRAAHRNLPESSDLTADDIGTDAWFRHVDQVVFWLHRSPPKPDLEYRRNLPGETWTLEVWEPEGTTREKRWYRLSIDRVDGTATSVIRPYDGRFVGQWVTDLDGNGRMEMILLTQSFGTGAYGNVIAFEWSGNQLREAGGNGWKLPGAGYMGHDSVTVEGDRIVRTFPVYLDGDSDSRPSGGRRQIQYCLQNGSLREVDRRPLK